MEYWDIYDKYRNKTGRRALRGSGEKLKDGEYRIVVFICVFNSLGQMLIQQRAADKDGSPNKWDFTAAGSLTAGEESGLGASRELLEEVGIDIDFTDKLPHFTINANEVFADFYLHKINAESIPLKLQKEEVQDAKWASLEEILKMIDDGSFVSRKKGIVQLCFELVEKPSTYI